MYSNSPEMHRNKTNTIGKLNLQFSKHSRLWQLLLHLHLVVQHVAGVLGGVGQVHLQGQAAPGKAPGQLPKFQLIRGASPHKGDLSGPFGWFLEGFFILET
jgi:hypothetical protein